MKTIGEVTNDLMIEELRECLEKCRRCKCLATVKQFARVKELNAQGQYEESIKFVNLQQTILDINSAIHISNNLYNVRLSSPTSPEFKKFLSYRDTVIERNHERYMARQEEDSLFTIDLVKTDEQESVAYCLSFVNPMFMTTENEDLLFICSLDNGRFGKHAVDFVAALEEAEYQEEEERAAMEKEEMLLSPDDDENEDILSNEDVLNVVDEEDEDY